MIEEKIAARETLAQEHNEHNIKLFIESQKSELQSQLTSDLRGAAFKWGGGAVLGFIAGSLAVWFFFSSLMPRMEASYSNLNSKVSDAIKIHSITKLDKIESDLQELQILMKTTAAVI